MSGQAYVYVLASGLGGSLYIGAATDLVARVGAHKARTVDGFTKKYGIDRLVYFEVFADIQSAVTRERQLKKWNRAWKVRLIEERNPDWIDLYPGIARQ